MVLTKKHIGGPRTGIVIAGFGEKDMFPKLINAEFMGVYLNTLKYDNKNITAISNENDVRERIELWSRQYHINPIMETVSIAPKEELAQMAETLVNLTSFRRNLSMDEFSQSVGGPIDVALITKGDGFIWMKRKHYFDLNINQHFVQNYFRDNRRDNRYDVDNRE